MTRFLALALVAASFGLASLDADAARRFGGGGNVGKQRATPTQREAAPAQQPGAPAQQAAPAPAQAAKPAGPASAAAPGAAMAKPSFMQRWGGLLAGLGIGALLASLFGAQLGPIIGLILAVMLGLGLLYLLFRLFAGRGQAPAATPPGQRPQFAGIGSGLRQEPTMKFENLAGGSAASARAPGLVLPPDFEVQPFLRVAKTSFIRLQAANDARDVADIRDYTTPEMFAEISMQMQERGPAAQKTEVVNVDAQLVDFATEDGYDYASVRFYGLMRDDGAANPEPFDEIWHVRRKAGDRKDAWLIAGIQQNP